MAAYFGIPPLGGGWAPPAIIGQLSAAHPVASERPDPALTATRTPIGRVQPYSEQV